VSDCAWPYSEIPDTIFRTHILGVPSLLGWLLGGQCRTREESSAGKSNSDDSLDKYAVLIFVQCT
jgi:hypothetical protein